jgi:putative ABC transport system permease protein
MIGQILGGSTPDVAIKYQMMIIVITISSSMVSIAVTLNMIKRVGFDTDGRIKNVSKESSREKR